MFKIGVLSSCSKHHLLISFSIPSISFCSLCFSCCLNSQVAKFLLVMQDEKYHVLFTTFKDDQEENLNFFFKELEKKKKPKICRALKIVTIAHI